MKMRRLPLNRTFAGAVVCLGLASAAVAHGIFEKAFWNDKANYATRGAAGSQATRLYMMQPARHLSGEHQSIGWRVRLQDEEAETQETCTVGFVRYAANGIDPDSSATGVVFSRTYRLFGLGEKGAKSFDFTLTTGIPQPLPVNVGLFVDIPAHAKWPADGASIHAQLNMPQDSRRPRVPAPYDTQVWAFEQTSAMPAPAPLGGRTLDTLNFGGLYIEPTMRLFNRSRAYGLGTEDLYGPEAIHPVADRGDALGIEIDGGIIGTDGWCLVYLSPWLAKTSIPLPRGSFWLGFANGFPIQILLAPLDSLGRIKLNAVPFRDFPPGWRSFWLQSVVINPYTLEFEATDAVGVQGL
jgi:hypothetical protein